MIRKSAAALLAAAILALGVPACGSDDKSDDQQGQDNNGIAAPIQAIPKAEDAARQTGERAQKQQDEINRQLDQLP